MDGTVEMDEAFLGSVNEGGKRGRRAKKTAVMASVPLTSEGKPIHWTHIVISNAKAFIEGTFHGIDGLHPQRYLDESRYRFNRRWIEGGVFPRLVLACASSCKLHIITYHELIG
jgi:hypothetical protein